MLLQDKKIIQEKTKNVTIKLNMLNQVSELKIFKYQPSQMITV